jgi:hypothetical protein
MPGPGLWMARHRAFTPVKTALRGITAPPLHAGYPAERCARRMQTNHRAGARRNPSPVEVRRVTKLPAHMASKPERSSRSRFALEGFYRCKKPRWLAMSLIRLVARATSRRSFTSQARHFDPPRDPYGRQMGRRAGFSRPHGSDHGRISLTALPSAALPCPLCRTVTRSFPCLRQSVLGPGRCASNWRHCSHSDGAPRGRAVGA